MTEFALCAMLFSPVGIFVFLFAASASGGWNYDDDYYDPDYEEPPTLHRGLVLFWIIALEPVIGKMLWQTLQGGA